MLASEKVWPPDENKSIFRGGFFLTITFSQRQASWCLNGSSHHLDLGHVHEARATADEASARKGQLGDGLVAAGHEGPGAVADPGAALEERGDLGVCLELLEGLERMEIGIGVVEAFKSKDLYFVSIFLSLSACFSAIYH